MLFAEANHSSSSPAEFQRARPSWSNQSFSLRLLVEEVVDSQRNDISRHTIKATIDVEPATVVRADRQALSAAILSLVRSAIDVMPNGGDLVVTSYASSTHVEVEVADSGPGVPAAIVPNRQASACISRDAVPWFVAAERVAHLHQGLITALNCPEGGAAYTISLPRSQAARAAA